MNRFRFWMPAIIGALATPIFLILALDSTGAGHGSYLSTFVFYPLPSLLLFLQPISMDDVFFKGLIDNAITVLAIGSAILQFPLYGFIISYSGTKKSSRFWAICRTAIWIHIIISLAVLPYAAIDRK